MPLGEGGRRRSQKEERGSCPVGSRTVFGSLPSLNHTHTHTHELFPVMLYGEATTPTTIMNHLSIAKKFPRNFFVFILRSFSTSSTNPWKTNPGGRTPKRKPRFPSGACV